MDSKYGSGSSKRPKTEAGSIHKKEDGLPPFISHVDSEQESGRRTDLDTRVNKRESPSSLGSSSNDFVDLDARRLPSANASDTVSSKTSRDAKPLLIDEKVDDCNDPLYELEGSFLESAASTSRVSDVSYEILSPVMTPMQTPPTQLMERNGEYDPDRIPSSAFSKPDNPTDWSEISNESLFSIQIGNNSSRDHVLRMSADLYKSGELPKQEEFYSSGEMYRSVEPRQISFAAKGSDMKKTTYVEKTSMIYGVVDEPTENFIPGSINDQDLSSSSSANTHSDGSGINSQPFAPLKKKKKKKKCACSSCHFFSCCSPSCCCWPSCSCKWLSCRGCSCKWLSCRGCSCKWLSCRGCSCKCLSCRGCFCKWFCCSSCSCKCLRGCCKCPGWCRCCSCKWTPCPSCC